MTILPVLLAPVTSALLTIITLPLSESSLISSCPSYSESLEDWESRSGITKLWSFDVRPGEGVTSAWFPSKKASSESASMLCFFKVLGQMQELLLLPLNLLKKPHDFPGLDNSESNMTSSTCRFLLQNLFYSLILKN